MMFSFEYTKDTNLWNGKTAEEIIDGGTLESVNLFHWYSPTLVIYNNYVW